MFGLPTCKEVFQDKHKIEKLPLHKKLARHVHLLVCRNCQHFLSTMNVIEDTMKASFKEKANKVEPEQIDSLKKQIKENIKKNIKTNKK